MLYSHPEKPLKHHLEEVELAAMAILGCHPREPFASLKIDVRQVMHLLAGWHDIAKATVFFQLYIRDTDAWQKKVKGNTASSDQKTHTPLGALLAADYFRTQQPWYLPLLMTMAIRGHHSRLPTMATICNSLDSQRELLAEQSRNLSPDVTSAHPSLEDALNRLTNDGFDAVYRKAMRLVQEDWPDRLEDGKLDQLVRIRLAVQFCFSCLLEADKALLIHPTVEDYFGVPTRSYPATLVEDQLPPGDTTTAINQQRRSAYQVVIDDAKSDGDDYRPRVLTLPTGLGKTRCAAGWAIHWRSRIESETGIRPKIIVVLPFLSVIEQTAKVYRELLGLADHSNDGHLQTSHSLSLRDHLDVETESLDGNAKDVALGQTEFMLDTWRSEIVLTTFDQFLLALMTATQPGIIPPSSRKDLIEQPRRYAQPRYQMEIDLREQPLSQWLDGIANEINSKPDVKKWLLVFNTRRCAQDVYRSLKDATSDLPHELMLLSSDIVPRDRLARIDRIKASDTCIAVTTQCVEAGVDIDMDRVIRDFAPLDSLVQVAGRCNRNGNRLRQTVRVVRLLNELSDGTVHKAFGDYIYDKVALSTSAELLRLTPIVNEEDVTDLVERYFAELAKKKDSGSELTNKWARFNHDDINIQRELRGDNNRQVSFVVEKLDPSLRVEIVAAYDEKDRWKRRRRLRDLGPRIAQVTVNAWLNKSFRPEDVAEPFPNADFPSFWFLNDRYYKDEVGLSLDNIAGTEIF